MKIGNIEIKGYAALAPMAGVADRAMREICTGYGAGYVVGEMTSSKGINYNDKKSAELLFVSDDQRPIGVQLFGDDAKGMAEAAIKSLHYKPDFIDINMGCPAPKIANNGGGSALMKRPKLAAEIVRQVKAAVNVPVTVKMRSGWDENTINAVELAVLCEDAGADAITVHGRTRKQMYSPPVDFEIIKKVKSAVSIPVIANGDIKSAEDAAFMYEETGCDFIMVGRAACGAPWIFYQINALLGSNRYLPEPPVSTRMLLLLKQIKLMIQYKGEKVALMEARKHAAFYMRGLKNAADYRRQCGSINSYSDLEQLCYNVVRDND